MYFKFAKGKSWEIRFCPMCNVATVRDKFRYLVWCETLKSRFIYIPINISQMAKYLDMLPVSDSIKWIINQTSVKILDFRHSLPSECNSSKHLMISPL